MSAIDYTIVCIGLLAGLMMVCLLFELYSKAKKDLRDQLQSNKALLEQLEATDPKEPVTDSSPDNQE